MFITVLVWILLIFLLFLSLYVLIWQLHLLVAVLTGAPVVYTHKPALADAYNFAHLQPGELIIDLGCGNAQALIFAAQKFGAKGIGVERSPLFYLLAKIYIRLSGQNKNIQVYLGDFKKIENQLKKADVIYLYLLNPVMKQIEDWFFNHISNSTRVVSMSFTFTNHQPEQVIETTNLWQKTKVMLYKK
ncbi:MAG: class I SAM-dependent methyltransferase [Patescibacteria group bacterium]